MMRNSKQTILEKSITVSNAVIDRALQQLRGDKIKSCVWRGWCLEKNARFCNDGFGGGMRHHLGPQRAGHEVACLRNPRDKMFL